LSSSADSCRIFVEENLSLRIAKTGRRLKSQDGQLVCI
jgi:hypothetical protein